MKTFFLCSTSNYTCKLKFSLCLSFSHKHIHTHTYIHTHPHTSTYTDREKEEKCLCLLMKCLSLILFRWFSCSIKNIERTLFLFLLLPFICCFYNDFVRFNFIEYEWDFSFYFINMYINILIYLKKCSNLLCIVSNLIHFLCYIDLFCEVFHMIWIMWYDF